MHADKTSMVSYSFSGLLLLAVLLHSRAQEVKSNLGSYLYSEEHQDAWGARPGADEARGTAQARDIVTGSPLSKMSQVGGFVEAAPLSQLVEARTGQARPAAQILVADSPLSQLKEPDPFSIDSLAHDFLTSSPLFQMEDGHLAASPSEGVWRSRVSTGDAAVPQSNADALHSAVLASLQPAWPPHPHIIQQIKFNAAQDRRSKLHDRSAASFHGHFENMAQRAWPVERSFSRPDYLDKSTLQVRLQDMLRTQNLDQKDLQVADADSSTEDERLAQLAQNLQKRLRSAAYGDSTREISGRRMHRHGSRATCAHLSMWAALLQISVAEFSCSKRRCFR
jgi:hypothetical protein